MRCYCDFYRVEPADPDLERMARALIADPDQGVQLICRDGDGQAIGFATVFWCWSTLTAARFGLMNDLYVIEDARGMGLADRLIEACADLCRERGIASLHWQTAPDNERAQAVYGRVGAIREEWIDYELAVGPPGSEP